jgi:hypothetical protein
MVKNDAMKKITLTINKYRNYSLDYFQFFINSSNIPVIKK